MRSCVAPLALLLLALPGCRDQKDSTAPEFTATLHQTAGGDHGGHAGSGLRTDMTGAEEVPARATPASGRASFRLSGDGSKISYELEVEDITNVIMAHLHMAPAGTNGGIVVWLYGRVPANLGPSERRLASGEFNASQLVGALQGRSLDDLMAAIRAGQIYVNVHTDDGDTTPNEGPGDFPGGEVRGQLGDK